MAELAGDEFIGYRKGSRLRELLDSAGPERDSTRITLESNEGQRIRRLIACGVGIAIMPRSEAAGPEGEFAVALLVEPGLRRDITLAWREGRRLAPAAVAFLKLARSAFAQAADGTDECAR